MTMIKIGASEQAVNRVRKAIMRILKERRGDQVTITALEVLKTACQVNNTTISGCTFKSKGKDAA